MHHLYPVGVFRFMCHWSIQHKSAPLAHFGHSNDGAHTWPADAWKSSGWSVIYWCFVLVRSLFGLSSPSSLGLPWPSAFLLRIVSVFRFNLCLICAPSPSLLSESKINWQTFCECIKNNKCPGEMNAGNIFPSSAHMHSVCCHTRYRRRRYSGPLLAPNTLYYGFHWLRFVSFVFSDFRNLESNAFAGHSGDGKRNIFRQLKYRLTTEAHWLNGRSCFESMRPKSMAGWLHRAVALDCHCHRSLNHLQCH